MNLKNLLSILILVCVCNSALAQTNKYSRFYYQRASHFETLKIKKTDVVFVGNSITNGAEWSELFNSPRIKNRGISGDTAEGVLDRLSPITKSKPNKVFLMIGINDLIKGKIPDSIAVTIEKIIVKLRQETPKTKIFLQSVLPARRNFTEDIQKQGSVEGLNKQLFKIASKYNITYINLYSYFKDEESGTMNQKYSNDGLHLMGEGYMLWKQIIKTYI